MLIGRYLIMNLLVAILLNAFADDSDVAPESPEERRRSIARKDADEKSPPPTPAEVRWPRDYSLFCFSPVGATRRYTNWLISQPEFEQVIIWAIVASSICLALDSPRLDPASSLAWYLAQLDLFWTALFVCELSLKVVSFTFCSSKTAYIYSPWNQVN